MKIQPIIFRIAIISYAKSVDDSSIVKLSGAVVCDCGERFAVAGRPPTDCCCASKPISGSWVIRESWCWKKWSEVLSVLDSVT